MNKGKNAKPHIGIFGRRNKGKSSIINALAEQEVAIVSELAGTTTDPVKKSMEIIGIGPVILIDTAGIDDKGVLGKKRISKSKSVLKIIDLAILVITDSIFGKIEEDFIKNFIDYGIPFFVIHNKSDVRPIDEDIKKHILKKFKTDVLNFNTINKAGIKEFILAIKKFLPESAYKKKNLIGDLVSEGDIILLITPIDTEAPEGRLILPQVQTIRDGLDNDCAVIVIKEKEIDGFIKKIYPKPNLVITDSQVFFKANASIPETIPLTSFSIILAHQKGDFANYLKGTPFISSLKDNDRVLLLESCTHNVSCDDIGRVKIPKWLTNFTKKKLEYEIVSGLDDLPRKITDYSLVIQCGGCMLTQKQIINRLKPAVDKKVPVTNYGMAIAYMHGIYNRAISPFIKKNIPPVKHE